MVPVKVPPIGLEAAEYFHAVVQTTGHFEIVCTCMDLTYVIHNSYKLHIIEGAEGAVCYRHGSCLHERTFRVNNDR